METTAGAVPALSLLRRLVAVRARSDELFSTIRSEAFHDRSISEHPETIFLLKPCNCSTWPLSSVECTLRLQPICCTNFVFKWVQGVGAEGGIGIACFQCLNESPD
jgi:hypothetical protein